MRNPLRSVRFYWPVLAVPLLLGLAEQKAKGVNYIYVTYTSEKVRGTGTGGCSLQEAIYSANLHINQAISGMNPDGSDIFVTTDCVPGTGTDTIVLPYSTTIVMSYPLGDAHSALGATGTPLISSNITIEANGSLITPIVGARPFRAFAVGGNGSLTLRNAYIKGFVEKGGDGGCGGGGGMGAGGAIYLTAGHLTVENSTFEANGAIGGNGGALPCTGGVAGGGGGGLSGNGGAAHVGGGGGGGAIGNGGTGGFFIAPAVGFPSGSAAGGGGGGTFNNGLPGATDGLTGLGGQLCGGNGGNAGLQGSAATCSGGGGGGGGVAYSAGNDGGDGGYGGGGGGMGQAGIAGGKGGFGGGGGGGNVDGNPLFATGGFGGGGGTGANGGLFAGHNVGGGAALGGAIFNEGGSVIVRNSTFTANFVDRGAASINTSGSNGADAGGAIFSLNGSLTVLNCTISGNQSTGSAGGIEVFSTATASYAIYNTIINNNGSNECAADNTSGGRLLPSGTGNLFGSGPLQTCNIHFVATADPQLGPLQNNRGLTPTMAIPTTSPAFNAADAATSLPSDQRSQPRPAPGMGGVPDIGAFELCLMGRPPFQMPCLLLPINAGTPVPLTIQVSPPGGGSTNPAPGTADTTPNSIVLLTATPNPGYAFVNWTGGVAAPTYASTAIVMDQAHTVTANFVGIPILNITKTHSGNFVKGQPNATYSVTVSNSGIGATSGTVTVNDTLPSGLVFASMSGAGWSCTLSTCKRSDALAPGASYPVITVMVNVQYNAISPQVNQVNVSYMSGGVPASALASDPTVIAVSDPTLTVDRTKLNFGYNGALMTSPQTVTVSITGGAGFNWTATSDHANVTVSPASGTGSSTFQVTATPPAGGGSGGAIITVSAPGATGSPQQIQVNVTSVIPAMPIGSFDTPANNTTGIAGAVAVTGWGLDFIEVIRAGIFREPVRGETPGPNGLVFIGNANFVADARPDVAATSPNLPYQYRAGWGYMLLTNFLPNSAGSGPSGNGTYNLHVLLTNKSGMVVDLGTRAITVDNAHASKPFGTIDTPDQGGSASGNSFVNFGWALTQNPFAIATDGSTINVIVDGVPVGHPVYNQPRSDIANLFPGLANSNGAVGFFMLDTTKLKNGVHTISWNVFDNAARGDGVGSRYFNVFNAGGSVAAPEEAPAPESLTGPIRLRSGYELMGPQVALAVDTAGWYPVEMEQLGRIELSLGASRGYLVVDGEEKDLPVGSSLKGGVFYWQAPVGFLGKYELLFERPDGTQIRVQVKVVPKQYSLQ